jgi:hypothetical protein
VSFQHPLDLFEEVINQRFCILELVRPTLIVLAAMPVVGLSRSALELRANRRRWVSVVEPDQPAAIRSVERNEYDNPCGRASVTSTRLISNFSQ